MPVNPAGPRHAGRAYVVTGGGSGIGRATVLRLAREGAGVAIADVRPELAESALAEVKALGGEGLAIACDVAHEDQVAAMIEIAASRFGKLDGLFSNAGTAGRGWIHQTTLEDWERVLRVNLTGGFLSAKHVLPHLLANGRGVIVTTGSIAVDYGAQGIRAVCLCPGAVRTDLGRHAAEDREGEATPVSEPLPRPKHWAPIPRAADPDEMASAVSFLFSDDASFITGGAFFVDGGLTAI